MKFVDDDDDDDDDDREYLHQIGGHVTKLCTEFQRNRTIRGRFTDDLTRCGCPISRRAILCALILNFVLAFRYVVPFRNPTP